MMGRYPALGPFRRPGPDDRRAVGARSSRSAWPHHRRRRSARCRAASAGACSSPGRSPPSPDLFLLDEPVTGVDPTTQEDLMDVLEAEARAAGPWSRRPTTSPRRRAVPAGRAVNRRVVADGPASLILDPDVLRATYGGHLLILDGQTVLLDDAHHHDDAPAGEQPLPRRDGRRRRPTGPPGRDGPLTEPLRYAFFVRALVASAIVGHRLRGRRHVHGAAGPRVHRRRASATRRSPASSSRT